MNLSEETQRELIFSEECLHKYLRNKGFSTNYNKSRFGNGVDVFAIKNGFVFKIEHKKIEKRENGNFRYNGELKGDFSVFSLPCGTWFPYPHSIGSITRISRFMELLGE